MARSSTFLLDNAWRLIVKELGLDAGELLRRAELPGDLFATEGARLDAASYYRLWECFEAMVGEPGLPLMLGEMLSVEHFSPPIFAALCSPHLTQAAQRLSQFKKLLAPMELEVDIGPDSTRLSYHFLPPAEAPPASFVGLELVFFVRLARIATKERIEPLQVCSPYFASFPGPEYEAFFGVPIEEGSSHSVVFRAEDATRPFLTANAQMWEFFQPELRQRLSELDASASTTARVQSALLELLPGGRASLSQVARSLGIGARTLQRRLRSEDTSFQAQLNHSREQLARHYLKSSSLTNTEIAILLGFDEPNSFFRAFHAWTGQTPERVRASYHLH